MLATIWLLSAIVALLFIGLVAYVLDRAGFWEHEEQRSIGEFMTVVIVSGIGVVTRTVIIRTVVWLLPE